MNVRRFVVRDAGFWFGQDSDGAATFIAGVEAVVVEVSGAAAALILVDHDDTTEQSVGVTVVNLRLCFITRRSGRTAGVRQVKLQKALPESQR